MERIDGDAPGWSSLLIVDRDSLDWRRAIGAAVVLLLALAAVASVGPEGMAAGLAALFVVVTTTTRPDLWSVLLVTSGALTTLVVGAVAGSPVGAALVSAGLTVVATFVADRGRRPALMSVLLLLWSMLALVVEEAGSAPGQVAAWFGVGGLTTIAVTWLSAQIGRAPIEHRTDPDPDGGAGPQSEPRERPSHARLTAFALLRGAGVGTCVWCGYVWFPEHLAWAAITFVLVLRPPRQETVIIGVGRALGTVAGVVVGVVVARLVGDHTTAQMIGFVAAGLFVCLFSGANYSLFTLSVTVLLLLGENVLDAGVTSAAWQRLASTFVGVGLAFVVIAVLALTSSSNRRRDRGGT